MKAAKCVLIGFSLVLLAGCVFSDDRGGRGFDRGQSEFQDQGRGPEQGRGAEQERGDQHYRPY